MDKLYVRGWCPGKEPRERGVCTEFLHKICLILEF